jgi:hypothetical protein
MTDPLEWKVYQNGADPNRFAFPPTTVQQIASRLQASIGARDPHCGRSRRKGRMNLFQAVPSVASHGAM